MTSYSNAKKTDRILSAAEVSETIKDATYLIDAIGHHRISHGNCECLVDIWAEMLDRQQVRENRKGI